MKIAKIITSIIAIIIALLLSLRRYVGGFWKVQIEEKNMGPYTFAYLSFTGSYYKVGPTMDSITQALQDDGIVAEKWLGIYYDDPAQVPEDQLRSEIWAIIESKDISKLKRNSEKYLVKTIPANKSVVATFPIKNNLSYMVWPMVVYPILTQYMTEKNYNLMTETMELYDMTGKITYYFVKIK